MNSRTVSLSTIKRLFACSGNCCAFPECGETLFFGKIFVAEVAHINAVSAGGPRYDGKLSPEEVAGYGNLLLLCRKHHCIIDAAPDEYPVDFLRQTKTHHEQFYADGNLTISKKVADQVAATLGALVVRTEDEFDLTPNEHGMMRELLFGAEPIELVDSIFLLSGRLEDATEQMNKYIDTIPGNNRNIDWALRVIGVGNFTGGIRRALLHLKISLLEYELRLNSSCEIRLIRLSAAHEELRKDIQNNTYYD